MSSVNGNPEPGSREAELAAAAHANVMFKEILDLPFDLEELRKHDIKTIAKRALGEGLTREMAEKVLKKIDDLEEEEKKGLRKRKASEESSSGYSSGEQREQAPRNPKKKKMDSVVPPKSDDGEDELGDDPLVEMRKIMEKHKEKMRLQNLNKK
uniref:CUE domain-containing protein n=1 Tax=Caenorhabditis tropicalis TaxID=1561998 RepID=A0A1I7UMA2_9PELO